MKRPEATHPIDAKVALRLDWLERLIDTEYNGSTAQFERETGIKMTQVNQWFTGYRALREKALARLTSRADKPDGWFDRDPEAEPADGLASKLAGQGRAATAAVPISSAPSSTYTLVKTLASLLEALDEDDREHAANILGKIAKHPDDEDRIAKLARLLGGPAGNKEEDMPKRVNEP